jgi:hypothetical protein
MKLTIMAIIGLIGFGIAGPSLASDQLSDLLDSAEGQAAVAECRNSEGSAEFGESFAHRCVAKDACGETYSATGICYNHAYNAALLKCKEGTKDSPRTCKIVDCCPVGD